MQRFRQHVNETDDVWSGWLIGEWGAPHKIDNRFCRTNHDLAFKRQLPSEGGAENWIADRFAHNERADRAEVHNAELRQLFRNFRRLTSIGAADVYRTKKYHSLDFVDLTTENTEFAVENDY